MLLAIVIISSIMCAVLLLVNPAAFLALLFVALLALGIPALAAGLSCWALAACGYPLPFWPVFALVFVLRFVLSAASSGK